MAFISFPTTWVPGQILTAEDLDAEFAAVTAEVNGNLDDTNVAVNAGIQGSKLADAPNGVPTGKINDGAITLPKLVPGVTVRHFEQVLSAFTGGAGAIGPVDLALFTSFTTGGGVVAIIPCQPVLVAILDAAGAAAVRMKVLRNGTQPTIPDYTAAAGPGPSGSVWPIPVPIFVEQPAIGTYVYHITIEAGSAAGTQTFLTMVNAPFWLVELA